MNAVTDKFSANSMVKTGVSSQFDAVLTKRAIEFVGQLHRKFNPRRLALLAKRIEKRKSIEEGNMTDFLPHTKDIREGDWTVPAVPETLLTRKVEIIGPLDKLTMINGLNSGADVYMADFEDGHSPTWENTIQGQINLKQAIRRDILFKDPATGQSFMLNRNIATIFVRPRGWHMEDKYILVDSQPVSASLLDFGLFIYHNAKELLRKNEFPCFYLPKIEGHEEARLWNDVFIEAQNMLRIPVGSIKATVIIETLTAAFEMDEILFELKEHAAGLNCGRWDYIFSFVKNLHTVPGFVLPERADLTMDQHFINSMVQLLIKTCHKRNTHAIGGMTSQTLINDNINNNQVFEAFIADKVREVNLGHDGTWVTHPGFVAEAKKVFDAHISEPNQIHTKLADIEISQSDLLEFPKGKITKEGLINGIEVAVTYLASWIEGRGQTAIGSLMEDTATAEILRTQIWHWLHKKEALLEDGTPIDFKLFYECLNHLVEKFKESLGQKYQAGRYQDAFQVFNQLVSEDELEEFLTTLPYLIL